MKLFNTESQRIEPFEPRRNNVSVYVCGITPYDTTHLGHAFTYTSMDVLIRYLEMRGLIVNYVQNVTDIDDDILKKAKEEGEDWKRLGNRWTVHFIEDMQKLNVRPPDFFPRATEVIPEIISSVQALLNSGVAYQVDGNVYYSVAAWKDFGRLSHIASDQMLPIANERGNFPDDPHKQNPLDFVLWQAQKPGEPAWESPWGSGRPGWHIECSSMSKRYLGEVVDIHGGGADLCFPHHECEIAQVEPISAERPFVRYWMHTAMVRYQGEKMSKSLGNLVMISDLLENYPPDALRIYLGSHHYRESWSYEEGELKRAVKIADKFETAANVPSGNSDPLKVGAAWDAFSQEMDQDLDTPKALEVMRSYSEEILRAAQAGRNVVDAQNALRNFSKVFGLRLNLAGPEENVRSGWQGHIKKFED